MSRDTFAEPFRGVKNGGNSAGTSGNAIPTQTPDSAAPTPNGEPGNARACRTRIVGRRFSFGAEDSRRACRGPYGDGVPTGGGPP
jgi:hypothetical protein